jgi:hypothetical protein
VKWKGNALFTVLSRTDLIRSEMVVLHASPSRTVHSYYTIFIFVGRVAAKGRDR